MRSLDRELSSRLIEALKGAFHRAPAQAAGPGPMPLLEWSGRFLPAHFTKPPSALHRWLADGFDAMRRRRGMKLNVVGPRGAAKSTVATLAGALRAAVEGDEPYLWIVSDTKDQAQRHLENLKAELLDNGALADAYPGATGRGPRWRASGIELRNGVVVEAYGAGQRLRGRRRRETRPTLIVCDDLQSDRHIASAAQREASAAWFDGALLKAGSKETNIVNVATALHRDALAVKLGATPGWVSKTFQSVIAWPERMDLWRDWERAYCDPRRADAEAEAFYRLHREELERGAEVLWPECEDLLTLMKIRIESGHAAFEREKQSQPIDPARCEWPEAYFDESVWFEAWPETALRVIAIDPSKGAGASVGDYSAIVLLGIDGDGVLHVEADLQRRPTPQLVADAVEHCQRFRPDVFGVEANQWQELLAGEFLGEFARRGLPGVTPCAIHNYTNKALRVRRIGPYLSKRRLRFRRNCPSTRLLVDQLRDFPLGSHDDGPDALEMALRLAEEAWRQRGEE